MTITLRSPRHRRRPRARPSWRRRRWSSRRWSPWSWSASLPGWRDSCRCSRVSATCTSGLYQRAFAIGGAFILLISLTSHGRSGEFFGPMIAFVWFFGIIDAVRQAKAINRGQLAEAGFAGERQLKASAGAGALTWGVILVGLGSLWLIDRNFEIDWSFMDDWGAPAAFIILGLILIVSHMRKRRRENDAQLGMPPRSR